LRNDATGKVARQDLTPFFLDITAKLLYTLAS